MSNKHPREERRSILAKYNILHDYNVRRAPGHEELFNDIEHLAQTSLDRYSYAAVAQSDGKPWRRQTFDRAKAISERVRRCLDERRNEAGWRTHLEHWIFSRFEVEVVW